MALATPRILPLSAPAQLRLSLALGLFAAALFGAGGAALAAPAAGAAAYGYQPYDAFAKQARALSGGPLSVSSLGKTAEGREVLCITVSDGAADSKPATVILGSVDARQVFASDLVLSMAKQLAAQSKTDPAVAELLKKQAFYFIPRPSPDASERLFQSPLADTATNLRPADDDHDGALDEDGPEDLNGDGWITSMRVKDGGPWTTCPLDPRLLMLADGAKGEIGEYSLYTEGRDSDGDGQVNEDPVGGTDLNRNFTFAYPYYQAGAGPHQVSEPESRALADFLFARSNVVAVFSISPQDNLAHPWQPNGGAEGRPVKTTLLSADSAANEHLCKLYADTLKPADAPGSDDWSGSLAPWAYFHYGRWSFSSRGWWVPKAEAAKPAEPAAAEPAAAEPAATAVGAEPAPQAVGAEPAPQAVGAELARPAEGDPSTDPVGAELARPADADAPASDTPPAFDENDGRVKDPLNALRWFAQNSVDGFADWTAIEDPDFPGRTVEIGGFRDFYLRNPPASAVEALAASNLEFLKQLAGQYPKLAVDELRQESLGRGIWRLTARISNSGYLPTICAMGETNGEAWPLMATLSLPTGAKLLTGLERQRIGRLAGSGGHADLSWLISAPKGGSVSVTAHSPSLGSASLSIDLTSGGAK